MKLLLALNLFLHTSLMLVAQQGSQTLVVDEFLNIPYDDSGDTLRQLNLVIPQESGAPLLVWIGGGAWSYVDRNKEMDLARHFAKSGIAVAAVGHRLSNPRWQDVNLAVGHQHPVHVRDVAKAIRSLIDLAPNYGYDAKQLFLGGFSSGAQLVALLCTNKKYLEEVGISISVIRGLIPISGTYDIADYHRVFAEGSRPEMAQTHVEAIFGDPTNFADASPVNFADNLVTPMLLISDAGLQNYTHLFEDKLRESHIENFDALYVHHLGHAPLWRNLSFEQNSFYRELILNFIFNTIGAKIN